MPTEQTKVVPRTGRCENARKPGGCPLHNLHCGYPKCDQFPPDATPATVQGSGGEPDPALLASMATCLNHGFGLLDERQRASMLADMRKLWDEVMGRGYYSPENRERYVGMLPPSPGSEGTGPIHNAADSTAAEAGHVKGTWEQAGEVELAIKTCLNVHGDREIAALLTRQASALAQARAECTKLREEGESDYQLIARQGALLTAAVNALRGEPPDGVRWSHHDVAELAAAMKARAAAAVGVLREAVDDSEVALAVLERADWQECTCEGCPECGKLPEECSGTECAATCQCSTCDHCRTEDLRQSIKANRARIDTLLASGGEGGDRG